MMKNKLRQRTVRSFAILLSALIAMVAVWSALNRQPLQDELSRPFRQVYELNGKIWHGLFNPKRVDVCQAPRPGKKPRINGAIGLAEPIDLNKWTLEVQSDDAKPDLKPLTLTMKDLRALPRTDSSAEFRCIEGWSEALSYAGVKFSDLIKAYHLTAKRYVGLETPDGEYYVSIDLESMMHDQTILAYEMNGEILANENGAPLRLVIPTKYGIKNLKRIGKIFFSDTRPPDYWAEQGYDWYAGL